MRSRVAELHYEYCAPKPECKVKLWDTLKESFPAENQEEETSINIYVHLVV